MPSIKTIPRFIIAPFVILAWFGVITIIFWTLSHISKSIMILIASLLVAYTVGPFVNKFRKIMPRFLAISLVYFILIALLSIFTFFVVKTASVQLLSLVHSNQSLFSSENIRSTFQRLNIPPDQLKQVELQITNGAEKLSASIIPFISSLFSFILDIIIVTVLSIYILIDGSRILRWIDRNTPLYHKPKLRFFLTTLNSVMGGYVRGQFTLSLIIGLIIGLGMFILQVPYAILLGVLAFILSFVPLLGVIISGGICILVALTKGWILALIVLAYFILAHIIEGDVLGPKIVGKALGLHPIVSILALLVGTELFGITGALFAAPIAGIIQSFLVSAWLEWRQDHTNAFAKSKKV